MLMTALLSGLLAGAVPQAGDVAPDFTVQDTEGRTHTLSEMVKQGPVIVAFFPKAFTSGCTKEMTAYRDRYTDLEQSQAQVLAVSTDDKEQMKKFKESLKASFPFIPDPEAKLTKLYDVKLPVMTMAQRYTFVVGEDRKVLKVESGSDAVDPAEAIAACPLKKKAPEKKP
jgi:thioredoxin-dependent peroxiredoxin